MINELLILQSFILILLFYFMFSINVLTLWYVAGLYLFSIGIYLLLNDGDIFVGFLWVIDLGVGLIFFIFILHFSNFLYQKSQFLISEKFVHLFVFISLFLWFFLYTINFSGDFNSGNELKKIWFFLISWYDFFEYYSISTITDLNILREIYFYSNSFEFFVANFIIFYGILSAIILSFLIKRIFNFLMFNQLMFTSFLYQINSFFFIRTQNFIRQQNTFAGTRVWIKNKYIHI